MSTPCSSRISSSMNAMAALKASAEAPSVLRVSSEVLTTFCSRAGVLPSASRIVRALRVITELSMPKGQNWAQRRQVVQE